MDQQIKGRGEYKEKLFYAELCALYFIILPSTLCFIFHTTYDVGLIYFSMGLPR